MALYKPATRVVSLQMPYLALVTRADPEFERRKHREVEYEFAGRNFLADPYTRGSFNRLSNTYPVGQAQGGLDALVQAALAPTVGSPTPGLYSGTPTRDWA